METTQKTETWDERMARQKEEETTQAEAIRPKIADVARHLDGDFVLAAQKDTEYGPQASGQIDAPDGRGLWIRLETYGATRGKLKISGYYPRGPKGEYIDIYEYDAKHERIQAPSIMVSAEKTGKQIAADIARRLMPAYIARLEKVRAKVAGETNYQLRTAAALETLKGAPLTEHEIDRHEIQIEGATLPGQEYEARASVHATREDITLELRHIDVKTAIRILTGLGCYKTS